MKKKTTPTPKPLKHDPKEQPEPEIADLHAWLVKLVAGRPME